MIGHTIGINLSLATACVDKSLASVRLWKYLETNNRKQKRTSPVTDHHHHRAAASSLQPLLGSRVNAYAVKPIINTIPVTYTSVSVPLGNPTRILADNDINPRCRFYLA